MTSKEYYNKYKGKVAKLNSKDEYGIICGYDENEVYTDRYRYCLIAAVTKGSSGWGYDAADCNDIILTHKENPKGYEYCSPIDCIDAVINITINV